MSRSKSTPATPAKQAQARKPKKPKPKREKGFPLFAHGSGQWAKKIRGKLHYFGVWAEPQAALSRWNREKDDLLEGREPRRFEGDSFTVGDVGELFLQSRQNRVELGEMSEKTLAGYVPIVKRIVKFLGDSTPVASLRPSDFSALKKHLKKGVSLKSLEGWIATGRAMFNHAEKNGALDTAERAFSMRQAWGTEFTKPGRKALRLERAAKGPRAFSRSELQALIEKAGPAMRAMILLGVNCGFGPTDCGVLEFRNLDLEGGWVELIRSKTGKPRRAKLWPETVEAIQAAIKVRPTPKDPAHAERVFITSRRGTWEPCETDSPPAKEFAKIRKAAGVTRGSFYGLRHTCQQKGDETLDFTAVAYLMGHAEQSISDTYRGAAGDQRLQAVAEHVRGWLFEEKKQ